MSEEIERTDCPRCGCKDNAWMGRRDIGVLVIHLMACDDCLLVWHVTTEKSHYGVKGRPKERKT